MIIASDRREVGIFVNALIAADRSFCAIDHLIVSIEQFPACHIAVFNNAAWVVGAREKIGSAHDSPPAICQSRRKKSQRKKGTENKIRLRLRQGRWFFIQMIANQQQNEQRNEGGQQRR